MRPPQKKRPWGGMTYGPAQHRVSLIPWGPRSRTRGSWIEFGADDLLFSHKNAADTSDAWVATAFVAQNYANRFIARKTVTLKTSTKPVAGGMAVTVGSGALDSIIFVGETISICLGSFIQSTCEDVHSRLVAKNLVSENPKGHPHPLMCAHMELEKLWQ